MNNVDLNRVRYDRLCRRLRLYAGVAEILQTPNLFLLEGFTVSELTQPLNYEEVSQLVSENRLAEKVEELLLDNLAEHIRDQIPERLRHKTFILIKGEIAVGQWDHIEEGVIYFRMRVSWRALR